MAGQREATWEFHRIASARLTEHAWEVMRDDGFCVRVPLNTPVEPRVGDMIGVKRVGALVYAMTIGERQVYDVEEVWAAKDEAELAAVIKRLWGY